MKPTFINKELEIQANFSPEFNPQNGNDCEVISASNLIQALNAELSWGSRNEDNSKIDLLLSFNHPWIKGQRTLLLTQVKSGNSFGKIENNKIKLYSKGIKQAKESQNSICLIWYDHITKENYWIYIHNNTKTKEKVKGKVKGKAKGKGKGKSVELGKNHILSPATRFEIARCISRNIKLKLFNSRGLILDFKSIESMELNIFRKKIKNIYKNFETINNPLYGQIAITNFGWKHMFRKSRLKIYKNDSLIILPYLKQILSFQPDRHWIISFNSHFHKNFTVLNYEHVLRYEGIKNNKNNDTFEIVIKLVEEVAYPTDWKKENVLSQKVFRKVILKSSSLKLKKA